jgi:hypothetical protein
LEAKGGPSLSDPLVIGLITTAVGVVLSVVLAPLGQRSVQFLLRGLSRVDCEFSWNPTMGEGSVDSPGGVRFRERQLTATLTNRKDVPVNVREMRVDFYKGGKPLDVQERPYLEFAGSRGGRQLSFELATLHPRIPESRTVIVSSGHDEAARQRAVEEADRIEFVAVIEGAKDIRTRLAPWEEPEPQTKRC